MQTAPADRSAQLVTIGSDRAASCTILDREALARYILSRQTPEGGYSYYRTPEWGVEEPNAPDTLAALESLAMLGIDPPETATTGNWLRRLQDATGGYPSLRIGWGALRSIAVLGIQPRRSPISWLRAVGLGAIPAESRHDWSTALGDSLQFLELSRLAGLALQPIEGAAVEAILKAARAPDGGWARPGPELESTAIAVRVARRAGIDLPGAPAATQFVRRCEDDALGLRLSPTAGATSVGALWGGLVVLQSISAKPSYPRAIAENLALLQQRNGGLGARHWAISTLHATWRGLEASEMLLTQLGERRS